jgi:hypothetical protein
LADKVATFAPTTIGYLYKPLTRAGELDEPRPIKVAKHLYDVHNLSEVAENPSEFIGTYAKVFHKQCEYRGLDISQEDALTDTLRTAFLCSTLHSVKDPTRNYPLPKEPTSETDEEKSLFLRAGCKRLASHLFRDEFSPNEVRIASSRAALAAACLLKNRDDIIISKMINEIDLGDPKLKTEKLTGEIADLNFLKSTDPVAFVLWMKAQEILGS